MCRYLAEKRFRTCKRGGEARQATQSLLRRRPRGDRRCCARFRRQFCVNRTSGRICFGVALIVALIVVLNDRSACEEESFEGNWPVLHTKMSHVPYYEVTGSRRLYLADCISPIWHLLRIMAFIMSILYATLVLISHGANKSTGGPIPTHNGTEQFSPLQVLLDKGQMLEAQILDTDTDMMKKINDHSTLELKTVVIAETVVPYDDRDLLSLYVKQQLEASDVMSDAQREAVLTMVNLAPTEAVVNKEEIGEKGSLRNSAVLALIKKHATNVHFMLIGVRAEPRLGWSWIPSAERNAWNDVLSRVLADKIRVEAKNYLWQRNRNSPDQSDLVVRTPDF